MTRRRILATKKKTDGLIVEADWSRAVLRDLPRTAMPQGTVYDATDFLLHRPGIAEKRGGTTYYGPQVSASVPSFLDSSSAAHEITQHGDAHIDTVTFLQGDGSAAFDGTGDYVTLDGDDDFVHGTGNFTIEGRLRLTALPSTSARIYDGRPAGAMGITPTNKLKENFSSGSSYTTTDTLAPQTNTLYLVSISVPDSRTVSSVSGCGFTWTQVATVTQGAFTQAVYRGMKSSGLSTGTITVNLSGAVTHNAEIIIDEFVGADTSGTDGSGAIIQSATNGSASATSLTVALSAFAGTSNFGFGAFLRAGTETPTPDNGYTGLAGESPGSGSSDTGIRTMYKDSDADPKATKSGNAVWAGVGIEIGSAFYPLVSVTSAGKVTFSPAQATSSTALLTSTTTLSLATWYHFAVVRNSSTTSLYIAGTSEASSADTHNYTIGTNRPAIGASGVSEGTEGLNGWLDELRVSNNARYTSGFSPGGPFANDANTMLLMHGDNYILSATGLRSVQNADFPTGTKVLATADDGHLYYVTADNFSDIGSLGAVRSSPLCKPVLHVSGTSRAIYPANDGTSGPYSYNGSTLAALAASAPTAKIAAIFKARLLLANSSANPNRLWFSPLDPSGTWDTSNAWVDFDHPITGLATVRNALLVFSSGHCDYLTGSVPPGTDGFDMAAGPLGDIGCADARSIDTWQDNVIFANLNGVYMTNGAAFRSVTEPPEFGNAGIGDYWRSLLDGANSNWSIAGGVIGDFYLVTVRDSTDTLVTTLMCYLPRRSWWPLANFDAGMYASRTSGPELYYAARDIPRVVTVAGIFTPDASNKNDADGTAVEPTLTTRFLGSGPTLKAYGFARVTYDARDAGDAPTVAVSVAPGAEAATFADVAESPLAATSDAVRKRFSINKDAQGVTVKFTQSGPSSQTKLFALEVEERSYQGAVDGEG